MATPVNSHRVDVSEEEREQTFQGKEQRCGGCPPHSSYQQPIFSPPGAYWSSPFPYMVHPGQQYVQNSAIAVPEHPSQHPHHHTSPMYPYQYSQIAQQPHPHYLAVNVHTDNHQTQSQRQASTNANKQVSVKEKVIKNVTRGLEQLLDTRVLIAGLATFLLPKVAHQLQQHKRRRRGLFLEFGVA